METIQPSAKDPSRPRLPQLSDNHPAILSRYVARFLDDVATIPGTQIRFGVDPILSLIPCLGSSTGLLFGSVIMVDAVRLRTPIPVLIRMVLNFLFDWLIGMIPVAGAVSDIFFRAHRRNLVLLEAVISEREQLRKTSLRYLVIGASLIALTFLSAVAITALLVVWLLRQL